MHFGIGKRLCGIVAMLIMGMSVSGCDYWPPALQAQIEQLQQEAQVAAAERTKMVSQVNEANTIKQELQARVDDLTRTNRELTGRMSGIEQALMVEREKSIRLAKVAAKPASMKTAGKPSVKKVVRKKPVTKKRAGY
jgi:hypothetical protein